MSRLAIAAVLALTACAGPEQFAGQCKRMGVFPGDPMWAPCVMDQQARADADFYALMGTMNAASYQAAVRQCSRVRGWAVCH